MARHNPFLAAALAASLAIAPAPAFAAKADFSADSLILKRQYQQAFNALLAAAKAGDAKAMLKLSGAYRYGIGTQRNDSEAMRWLEASAKAGNAKAKLALQHRTVNVQATVKKQANAGEAAEDQRKVDFTKLPPRPPGAVAWPLLAVAQQDHAAVAVLGPQAPAQAILVAAALGDANDMKALPNDGQARDSMGRNAVMLAAASGHDAALGVLLASKVDMAMADKSGQTAVGLAAAACDGEALAKLADAGASLVAPVAALPLLVQRCPDLAPLQPFMARQDLNAVDTQGRSSAWFAAKRKDTTALAWLVSQGADVNRPDEQGFAPLLVAAGNGELEAIKLLLASGANPAAKSKRGVSALMLAAASGCTGCVNALLGTKPTVDEKDADGDTALIFAVRSLQGAAAQLLADSGANPNARNNSGDTAGKLAQRLQLQAGAPN